MRNRTAIVTWYVSLVLLCAVWAFAPSAANSQEKKNLRVVFTGLAWNSELPFRVALVRGFFKAQGLDVQPIFVRGGPAALAALSSGEVDFAEIGGAQAIMRSRARGLDAVIIGAISNATNYQIVGSKSTRTLEEMQGKTIGVTRARFPISPCAHFCGAKGSIPIRILCCAPSAAAICAQALWKRVLWQRHRLLPTIPSVSRESVFR